MEIANAATCSSHEGLRGVDGPAGLERLAGARVSSERRGRVRRRRAATRRSGSPSSRSPTRGARSAVAGEETGDASFIFVEGDVSVQTAGHSSFEGAKQRQSLFDGDFIKTGRTGSAEIMFSDGTLYTVRPGSLFEVRRPASADVGGSQVKMVSGAVNVYTSASQLDGRDRCGHGRDRQGVARRARRRAGRQDRGHDFPRQDDRVDRQGDDGPRRAREDHGERRKRRHFG